MQQTKTCSKCHTEKPLDKFHKSATSQFGRRGVCAACISSRNKRPRVYVDPTEKLCRGCNKVLPIGEFYVRAERTNGWTSRCKSCSSASHAAWRDKNPGASRNRNLKSKYGMSADEYMKLLADQGGGCAVCGRKDSGWRSSPWLHVDHCHSTGKVRSLLCHKCNIVVGYVENGDVPLDEVTRYLTEGFSVR